MERIVHVTTFADSLGGMQAVVNRHRAQDLAAGFEPMVVKLFEPAHADADRGSDLGLKARWWWNPAGLRERFCAVVPPAMDGALAVYHNGWALPLLAPGDRARRRLAYLHTDWPHFERAVRAMQRWCDGLVAPSEEMHRQVRQTIPHYPSERIHLLAYPVEPPAGFSPTPSQNPAAASRPFRVGIVGRLQVGQKRLDRLPPLIREVARRSSPVAWDVIGEGPALDDLRSGTNGADVTFHGRLAGADYWRQLARLDAIVFLSDYEGGPIALLEAMTCGAVPLYPGIGGLGERYARQVDACCVYPPGDLATAAENLATLAGGDRAARAARARAAVGGHRVEDYERSWMRIVRAVNQAERISSDSADRSARLSDLLPFALVERYAEAAIWR